jgi:hypothetical protein
MFKEACQNNREAIYGIKVTSKISNTQLGHSTGSGYAIAPGIIATAGHLIPKATQYQTRYEVIRSPDIGQQMEFASLISIDPNHDIALLKIDNPRSEKYLTLEENQVPIGTSCGSLGFPLSIISESGPGKIQYNLVERFQGSYISAYVDGLTPSGKVAYYYEIDSLMYNGSSGCPGFLVNSKVIGMQSQSRLGQDAAAMENARSGKIKHGKGIKKPVTQSQLAISMWVPSMDILKFAREKGINI